MQKAASGGGGIFKTAAAEILRSERRLMSTGVSLALILQSSPLMGAPLVYHVQQSWLRRCRSL